MVKIGLEIHGYLSTKEKLFCSCKSEHGIKHSRPNTNICPICTGQPGAKPLLPNEKAVEKAVKIALALGCKINKSVIWQRKHYDWPDLPKGYQNTLSGPYAIPTGKGGNFLGIRITEVHLEEDPAAWNPKTGEIDYNRSGVPLIEIVTEPDFESQGQVIEWLKELITTLEYIRTIDKKSGIKVDTNISIPRGKRVEIKNINSLNNVEKAIEYEIKRQKKDLPKSQETRRFDEIRETTIRMRSKEQTEDYRFISDPDLPSIKITQKRIDEIRSTIPETSKNKLEKLIKKYRVEKKYAEILVKKIEIVEFFESVIKKTSPQLAARWIIGELLNILNYNKKELDEVDIKPDHFIELLNLIEKRKITELKAQEILRQFIPKSFSPKKFGKKHSMISGKDELEKLADTVIKENEKAVSDYKTGKKWAINFLIGKVMKLTDKRADFKGVRKILEEKLK